LAFLSAVISLVASFATTAAPIPLYNIYRAEEGLTNFGISMAAVSYSVGTIAGLLVLGRLSNHLGRRLTAIASLGLLLLGCLLRRPGPVRPLATRPHLPGLRWLPITVCRTHRHQPGNRNSDAGRLAITGTPGPRTGPGQASAPRLPSCLRWSKINSTPAAPLIHGLVFAAYMAPSVLGAPIGGRFTSAVAQGVRMITGMIGIITAINAGTLAFFIIATMVAGAGQGIAISAATRGLLQGSTLDRAPIFSAIYLLCYGGATFPSIISGELSNAFFATADRLRIRSTCPRRHPVHCPRCTQSAH
jgi:MFS family permease